MVQNAAMVVMKLCAVICGWTFKQEESSSKSLLLKLGSKDGWTDAANAYGAELHVLCSSDRLQTV